MAMNNYHLLHRRLAQLEASLDAQERASYEPDLLISLPWYGRQEEETARKQALAALKTQVTREAERRRFSASYILIAHQQPDGSWLAEVPWNTPQQREQLTTCQQLTLEEGRERGYIRQGTAHPRTAQEGDE